MLRFSTTLLLAAACLLASADFPSEIVTTCLVGTVHRLSCDSGVISVQTSMYGRSDSVTCSEGNSPEDIAQTDCSVAGAVDVVKKRCDGKKVCELNNSVFETPDPCANTVKYIQTKYSCLPAIYQVTCEHSLAYMKCDEGQVISVYGADYGRRDQTTCIYGRPDSQFQNIYCSEPSNKVAESCDGKNSCIVRAGNSVFGDPCPGTFKYLEVAYTCLWKHCIIVEPGKPTTLQSHSSDQIFNTMLLFRLCTALLLVASVVSTERAITCDGNRFVQHLNCDNGVIRVQAAQYGRRDGETCSEGRRREQLANTECSQEGTVDVLRKKCDGKKVCEINMNILRTSDPCEDTYKYLETNYTCFPAIRLVACEHSLAYLFCDKGQVIFVYGADYGRRDQTTCAYKRSASQVENVDCLNPSKKVADSCNGKNSCTIRASNSVFGDPCIGTYKYLEVAYVCEYPLFPPEK
ncbi:rhamnose-binding lectin-like [Mugil cephalus]|uniref:rhamnose-binding lectin-like n=1 Tax=Mugil cephalus TaxID=48193 RepID=UPI001FB57E83|nr:rhamnose-binding lectin-like [Mugil cephalus]